MEIQYENGYWKGRPAKFRVVMAVVGGAPIEVKGAGEGKTGDKQQHEWFVPLIGEPRQVVEVIYDSTELFYLDNEDGSGLAKVTAGIGDSEYEYRLLYPSSIVATVRLENRQYYSMYAAEVVNRTIADAWKEMEENS